MDSDTREDIRAFVRRGASIALECLLLIFWAAAQWVVALALNRMRVPGDVVYSATLVIFQVAFALLTLAWVGIHVYREIRILVIRARADIEAELKHARHNDDNHRLPEEASD